MSAKRKENAAIVGVGVAACAVCCAGPILGVLAAIGLGTAAGFALFGALAIVIGAVLIAFVVVRRRRRVTACATTELPESVPVELSEMRSRS
jgi:Flp pilus assembly protein TadB